MNRQTILGGAVILAVFAGLAFFGLSRPSAPASAPETAQTPILPAGQYVEHAAYYDIVANYATSTPLSAKANVVAIRTMQQFIADTIAEFKKNGNFDSLTARDIQMMGYDKGRKQTLDVKYLFGSSSNTVSYIYTIYMDTLGAHGNTDFKTFTFDKRSGALLSLADVFLPGAKYLDTLSSKSRSMLAGNLAPYGVQSEIDAGTTPEESNFSDFFLDNRDFVILFPPYQVAAYAAGPQTVRIPLSDLSSILKPAYR
ncbi:MAG TPA: RsiV family protein [Candidatus Paceibacterota bacterium]|nr:RsiV family protein [Candidatus Paceibacterota bacterium]